MSRTSIYSSWNSDWWDKDWTESGFEGGPQRQRSSNQNNNNVITKQQSSTQIPTYSQAKIHNSWIKTDFNSSERIPTPLVNNQRKRGNSISEKDNLVSSAGLAGGVLGFALGGPVMATVLGFSSAFCTQKDGPAGDVARALGDVGKVTTEKAIELDEKHRIVDQSKRIAVEALEKAQELDRTHHIVDQVIEGALWSGRTSVKFVREHRLIEKGTHTAIRGLGHLAERVSTNGVQRMEQQKESQKQQKHRIHQQEFSRSSLNQQSRSTSSLEWNDDSMDCVIRPQTTKQQVDSMKNRRQDTSRSTRKQTGDRSSSGIFGKNALEPRKVNDPRLKETPRSRLETTCQPRRATKSTRKGTVSWTGNTTLQ